MSSGAGRRGGGAGADKARVMELVQARRFEDAKGVCKGICSQVPGDAEAWFLLGAIHGQLGEFAEAEACCREAVRIEPAHAGLYYNLGIALLRQGKRDEAVESFEQAVRLNPEYADAYHDLGNALQGQGRYEEALGRYREALRLCPDAAMVHYNAAKANRSLERWDEAISGLEHAVQLKPDFAEACADLAELLIYRYRYDDTVELLERSIPLLPANADLHFKLGVAYGERGDLAQALRAYERTLELDPDHVDARSGIAGTRMLQGDYSGAYEILGPLISRDSTGVAAVLTFSHLAHRFGREADAISALDRYLADPKVSERTRSKLLFARASIHDRRQEYDEAFRGYGEANRLRGARFDRDSLVRTIEALRTVYNKDALSRIPRASDPNPLPVFIVGMPRSGTTLVEQVLASYSQVFGAGELRAIQNIALALPREIGSSQPYPYCMEDVRPEVLDRIAGAYCATLADLSPGAVRVTDKTTSNFMHLGLLDLLFPGCHVIHCVRDPLDTCLSCYFTNFSGAYEYAYDLEDLGAYYRLYEKLMRHWKSVLRVPILEVRYEDMVAEQERTSRRLVEFCGLEWQAQCLAFHENKREVATASFDQVRKPIYRASVERWRHYATYLDPLRQALGIAADSDDRR